MTPPPVIRAPWQARYSDDRPWGEHFDFWWDAAIDCLETRFPRPGQPEPSDWCHVRIDGRPGVWCVTYAQALEARGWQPVRV